MADPFYNEGSRQMQDRFDSRRLADRLEQVTLRRAFTNEDRSFIARAPMFFLATADAQGRPDCSYKGGVPGFVQVVDDVTLVFPSYDGNGMFLSMGNIAGDARIGLLFMDFEPPHRLRVHARAVVSRDDPLLGAYPGADLIVRAIRPCRAMSPHRHVVVDSAARHRLGRVGPRALRATGAAPGACSERPIRAICAGAGVEWWTQAGRTDRDNPLAHSGT